MQGRNKDSEKYPVDREIIAGKPMLQIHRIILQEDIQNFYQKDDEVSAVAIGLPKDILIESLITSIKTS